MVFSKKSIVLAVALAGILLYVPHMSLADTTATAATPAVAGGTPGFVSLANYNQSTQFNGILTSGGSLSGYLNAIFTTVLSVGAVLAVLRIAWAGYLYMGSADMWGSKQQAREMLGDAIIGLLLLFGIYLILYQINPNLLNLNVLNDISSANATTCQSANCTGVYGSPDVTPATTASISSQPVSGDYCFQATSGTAQVYGCASTMSTCQSAQTGSSGTAAQSITVGCQQF
jgi:hypothetical protein